MAPMGYDVRMGTRGLLLRNRYGPDDPKPWERPYANLRPPSPCPEDLGAIAGVVRRIERPRAYFRRAPRRSGFQSSRGSFGW